MTTSFLRLMLAVLMCQAFVFESRADDWPQWLGPNRDSEWRETGIIQKFPPGGPRVKWRVPVSGGYAGPAVAKGRVFVLDYVTDGDQSPSPDKRNELEGVERVICFDAETGQEIWKYEYDCPYAISFPSGPRCTPTVDGDFVYTLGSEGDLKCLETQSGRLVWDRSFKKDFGAKTPIWGFCGHPLIEGNRLLCVPGGPGALAVALDKKTGETIWKSLDAESPGYAPPTIIDAGGVRQLLIWDAASLNSINPLNGESYWSESLEPNYGMAITTPRMTNGLLFVGAIVNKSMLLSLDPDQPRATVEWYGDKETGIDPVNSSPFAEDEHLYGVDRRGKLCCVKLRTGETVWSTFDLMPSDRGAQSGTAFLIKNQDRFFLPTDSGDLVIAQLTPDGYTEIDRTSLLSPTGVAFGRKVVWSHPAFANRCIFARNDQELVCISLAADEN